MLAWSALLVQKIDLQVRGLAVRKLQVNRHRVAEVQPHAHAFGQAILYLSGAGGQIVGERTLPARDGDLFLIPAGREHGFAPRGHARPICLVLDYDRRDDAGDGRLAHRRLEPAALNTLHGLLSRLPRKGGLRLGDYASVAAVVALLFDARTITPDVASVVGEEPAFQRVRQALLAPESATRALSDIAREVGYHSDHLTRKLRRESGQGLRDMRNSLRLEAATSALRAGANVGTAAAAAGFADPGYFGRWFRRRTGRTPTAFRQGGR